MNKFAQIVRNSGPARFFVPLGIILIIVGVILLGMRTDTYEKANGTVASVTDGVFEDNEQKYNVDVTYRVGEKEYSTTLFDLSGSFAVGESMDVYYDPANPEKTSNTKVSGVVPPVMIGVGALAIVFGLFATIKAFKKSKALNESSPEANFDGFKQAGGVTEYYFRWDENSLKPGYLIEDANRNVLFEGKMLKNAAVGARTFAFTNRLTGESAEHAVGHTMTQSFNDSFFSAKSSFKFDGENIWDLLHGRGLRIKTGLFSKFPNLVYEVSKDGEPFAQIESTGKFVHEDEAAQHTINLPVGRMFYRCWTASNDFETLFLTMFAISETEQTVVE